MTTRGLFREGIVRVCVDNRYSDATGGELCFQGESGRCFTTPP